MKPLLAIIIFIALVLLVAFIPQKKQFVNAPIKSFMYHNNKNHMGLGHSWKEGDWLELKYENGQSIIINSEGVK